MRTSHRNYGLKQEIRDFSYETEYGWKQKRLARVTITSDSQSAVGLLTFGWTPSSYQGTINQTKQLIDSLKQKGLEIDIAWTPGHADIARNEIADKLAEAAKKAESIDENKDRMVTAQDIKTAVKQELRGGRYRTCIGQNN